MVQRKPLSADENLVVGMAGGTLETCLLMPVLTWKFCSQEGRPYPKFPGMYRGVAVQAGNVAPLTASQMVINGLLERALTGSSGRALSDLEALGCGLGAGACSAVLYAPVDLTMIQQQRLGLGVSGAVQHIIKTRGMLGLWRGFVSTAAREAVYTSGYLSMAPIFQRRLMKQPGWEESYWLSAVLGSCTAGVIANLLSHPVDTSKTNLQADLAGETYGSATSAFARLYQTRGVRALYSGGLARTIRGCGAFFVVSSLREQCIANKTERGSYSSFW